MSTPISETRLKQIREETEKDKTLQTLYEYTQHGWPQKGNIDCFVKPFHAYRDEIWAHEGILYKGLRIIIPFIMRQEIIRIIHEGHLEIEKCRIRAQNSVFLAKNKFGYQFNYI